MDKKTDSNFQPYDKNALASIADELSRIQADMQAYPELTQELSQLLDVACRAIRQFAALDTMIIVTCGMLKAGKSTLINLLARSNMASPVDFGVDTTMRPAVIRMSDSEQGQIRCYYAEDSDPSGKESLLQVFDELRKVPFKRRAQFTEEKYPLTPQNLKDFLCGKVPSGQMTRNPLLVVVETPLQPGVDCLLSGGIMLLDMPGLDSANAGISIMDYANIVAECDMMFYVQSSVSPLNSQAEELLKRVLSYRHAETTYVIQNCMMAQPWWLPAEQRLAQERQAQKARSDILRCFREGGAPQSQSGVRCLSMNLGMAYDAIVGNRDGDKVNKDGVLPDGRPITPELLVELSEFPGFEKDVRKTMQECGLRYRVQHCVDELSNRLADVVERLGRFSETKLRPDLDDIDRRWKSWTGVRRELERIRDEGVLSERPQEVCLSVNIASKITSELAGVWENVRDRNPSKFALLKNKGGEEKGSVLDDFLVKCSASMSRRVVELLGECTLQDIEVVSGDGRRTLRDFLNDSLARIVFGKCRASAKKEDPNLAIYQEVDAQAPAGFAYEPTRSLRSEFGDREIPQLPPSDLGGTGYPFKRERRCLGFTFGGLLGEKCSKVNLAHQVLDEMVNDYLDAARSFVAKHGPTLVSNLYESGKTQGMDNPLGYVAGREQSALADKDRIRRQMDFINASIGSMTNMETTVKGIH